MLDMSVRAKILELMLELKDELGLTYIYITHDLATAKFFCDRIAIMYLGRIVEIGPAAEIYADPKHPYTQALLRAIPEPDPTRSIPRDLPRGEVPDAVVPPLGCPFHPRCPQAFEVCGWESRDLRTMLEVHWTRLEEDEYEAEQELIGDLDSLDEPATEAVSAGRGRRAKRCMAVLERIRDESPDDPFWRGVAEMGSDGNTVTVRFHEGRVPRDLPAGNARVLCHLHDGEALEVAQRLRTNAPEHG